MNKVILIGRVTRELEHNKYSSSTSIVINEKYKKDNGYLDKKTYVEIVFFGKMIEVANKFLNIGKQVAIEGKLNVDIWKDESGRTRTKYSVHVDLMHLLGDSKKEAQEPQINIHTEEETPF